ncbi:MAG: 2-phosphosulfolactate phosphatase [Thermovirgaceae bacterium]
MTGQRKIHVCLSPLEELPQVDVWLVVDIIRASSVVVAFFDEGGRVLVPVDSVGRARVVREKMGSHWLLMGERDAVPPEGFDLGNSPRDLLGGIPEEYAGAVMTTSNGTKAWIRAWKTGHPVLCAGARNAAAIERALDGGTNIGILCAGRKGRAAMDDTACAGLLVSRILSKKKGIFTDDGAKIALALWETLEGDLGKGVRMASHMGILKKLGMEEDVEFCCKMDMSRIVPEMSEFKGYPAFFGGKKEDKKWGGA